MAWQEGQTRAFGYLTGYIDTQRRYALGWPFSIHRNIELPKCFKIWFSMCVVNKLSTIAFIFMEHGSEHVFSILVGFEIIVATEIC